MTDHLLALLVEVSSVTAAGKNIKRPLSLPRPTPPKPKPALGQSEKDAAFEKGIGVLKSTARGVK